MSDGIADPVEAERQRVKAIKTAARELGTPADLLAMVIVHGFEVDEAIARFQEFKTTGHCRVKASEWGERPPVVDDLIDE